jgi:serine protease Do
MIIPGPSNQGTPARVRFCWLFRLVAIFPFVLFGMSLGLGGETSDPVSADLAQIFAGQAPRTLSQLKAMERHQRRLAVKVTACTVGVIVGPSHGSGVIVSEDGYVLTAAHVVGEPNRTAVFVLADGRRVRGTTLGIDRTLDAGLAKIVDQGPWPHAEFAEADSVRPGQWCIASGHPGGFQEGREPVVRIGRVLRQDRFAITTDCVLAGGDSGGPLLDMYGRIIGINSRIGPALTNNIHVPVNAYRQNWDRLVKAEAWGGFLRAEPYIGVQGDMVVDVAKISVVHPHTPAERAGIKSGDIVIRFNGHTVTNFASLRVHVNDTHPGDKVPVTVLRGQRRHELSIVVGCRE